MLTKKENGSYIIAENSYDKFPQIFDQKIVDDGVSALKEAFHNLNEVLNNISPEVSQILLEMDWDYETLVDKISNFENIIDDLIENFSHDDDILSREELWNLTDEGFKQDITDKSYFVKTIESNDENLIEEIIYIYPDGTFSHRACIIYWDNSIPGVLSSKEIIYKDLDTSAMYRKYIDNTRRDLL